MEEFRLNPASGVAWDHEGVWERKRREEKTKRQREPRESKKKKKNYELREEGRKPREHTANLSEFYRDQKVGKRKPSGRIMLVFPVTWQDGPRQ